MNTKITFRKFKQVLDPKCRIVIFMDAKTIVFEGKVYKLLDYFEYDEYLIDDMYINFDNSLYVLIKKEED